LEIKKREKFSKLNEKIAQISGFVQWFNVLQLSFTSVNCIFLV